MLTPSVVKRIKAKYLHNTRFPALNPEMKTTMKNEILDHVQFTRKDIVAQARTCSISFFLAAICDYIQTHPTKCRIIRHLTLQEYIRMSERFQKLARNPIARTLDTPDIDPWHLFRYYALGLIHQGPIKQVDQFIQVCPAVFHPEKDRFIRAVSVP